MGDTSDVTSRNRNGLDGPGPIVYTVILLQAIKDLQTDTDKKISGLSNELSVLSKCKDKLIK